MMMSWAMVREPHVLAMLSDPEGQGQHVRRSGARAELGPATRRPGASRTFELLLDSNSPCRGVLTWLYTQKNPFAPEVPCHRVVAASREIGGFMGASSATATLRELARCAHGNAPPLVCARVLSGSIGDESPNICKKREMLTKEGVAFTPDRKVSPARSSLVLAAVTTANAHAVALRAQIDESCLHHFDETATS